MLIIFLLISFPILSLGFSLNEREFPALYAENGDLEAAEPTVYDPFIDYTEFERDQNEREDIRFFKEGRFVVLGLGVGGRLFTGTLQHHVMPLLNYGVYTGIFLNLNFMIQAHGLFSIHQLNLGENEGLLQFHGAGLDLKYYFDKERLVRALAVLNPYLLVGFSAVRSTLVPRGRDLEGFQQYQQIGYGFRTGGGFEIQLGKRFFTGVHADFNFVDFGWEFQEWELLDGSVAFLKGDLINILYVFGLNF